MCHLSTIYLSNECSLSVERTQALAHPVSVHICFSTAYRSCSCFVKCFLIKGQKAEIIN